MHRAGQWLVPAPLGLYALLLSPAHFAYLDPHRIMHPIPTFLNQYTSIHTPTLTDEAQELGARLALGAKDAAHD
jgi:hypothetical protein